MGDRFGVDTDELDGVVRDLVAAEGSLDALAGDVARLVDALQQEWAGLAAEAQQAAHQEWRRAMLAMHTALGGLRAALDTARVEYDGAAAANLAAWRQVAP